MFDLHPCLTSASTATFYISEGLPKGSVVGSLTHVTFDVVSTITPQASDLKVTSKIITTNVVLDRETVPSYEITLVKTFTQLA